MDIMIRGLAFAAASLCAALMGFAIQRGATCTVAAIDQVVSQRKFDRHIALLEASLWVCGGLLIAHRLSWLPQLPMGYALTATTFGGAVLLGLGAFVNRGCVFGAVARFGSGEWAYALTPVGFYLGCLAIDTLPAASSHPRLAGSSIVFSAPDAAVWLVAGLFAWRIGGACVRDRTALRTLVMGKLWSPHAATSVIGVAFLAMLLLVGAWAYTDALADLARGMTRGLPARLVLVACLLGGAVVGGWTAGRFRSLRIDMATGLRCLVGGVMMGVGSMLIPGSNDGLILVGLPMLWPYAWVAFLTMCLSVGMAQWMQARLAARSQALARAS